MSAVDMVGEMYRAKRAATEAGWIVMESGWLQNRSEDEAVAYVLAICERHEDERLNVADALRCDVRLLPEKLRSGVQVAKGRFDILVAQELPDRLCVEP